MEVWVVFALVLIAIVGTSVWVAFDSRNIGARKGLIRGFADMGPAGWFFCSLLMWIIGFPLYLAKRSQIQAAAASAGGLTLVDGVPGRPAPTASPQRQSKQVLLAAPRPSLPSFSKADEISKFDALMRSGALSQDEFDREKAKLLGLPTPPPV